MTDIMLNMPRKVVHEYNTPMMFCTVPTDPPAAFHTINQNADTMSKNLPSNHLWVEHVLVMALYAVIATNTATCGTCVAVSLQQEIPLCAPCGDALQCDSAALRHADADFCLVIKLNKVAVQAFSSNMEKTETSIPRCRSRLNNVWDSRKHTSTSRRHLQEDDSATHAPDTQYHGPIQTLPMMLSVKGVTTSLSVDSKKRIPTLRRRLREMTLQGKP